MPRVALLVIDFQHGLIVGPPAAHQADATLAVLNAAIGTARAQGWPVIFVRHEDADELPCDSGKWALHSGLDARSGDLYIAKTACDSFLDTPLQAELAARQVDSLWIGGYATEFCIDTSVRSAAARGYRVTVLEDGHTTQDRAHLSAGSIRMHHAWVWARLSAPGPVTVQPLQRCLAALASSAGK